MARKELLTALHDADPEVRLRSLEVLKQSDGKQTVPVAAIARCLADPEADVRLAAAQALAGLAGRSRARRRDSPADPRGR